MLYLSKNGVSNDWGQTSVRGGIRCRTYWLSEMSWAIECLCGTFHAFQGMPSRSSRRKAQMRSQISRNTHSIFLN